MRQAEEHATLAKALFKKIGGQSEGARFQRSCVRVCTAKRMNLIGCLRTMRTLDISSDVSGHSSQSFSWPDDCKSLSAQCAWLDWAGLLEKLYADFNFMKFWLLSGDEMGEAKAIHFHGQGASGTWHHINTSRLLDSLLLVLSDMNRKTCKIMTKFPKIWEPNH